MKIAAFAYTIITGLLLSIQFSFSQTYFFEDFNYTDFNELNDIYQNTKKYRWKTQHAIPELDISENNEIDIEETFKKTTITQDPFNPDNKIIRLELNKMEPSFYSKYKCDNDKISNVIDSDILANYYDPKTKSYCIDCSKSPLQKNYSYWRTHMNRNEITIYGKKRKLYKPKRAHWFGLRMLIDSTYQIDKHRTGEIVTQFHLVGKKVKNPPVALLIVKDRFVLAIIKNNDGKNESYDLGPVIKDKWIDWKYHIAISKKDKKGIVEVWRNGKKVFSKKGKNAFKNYKMFFKIGVYKWGWWDCNYQNTTTKKVISFDKVWVNKYDKPF